MHEEEFGDDDDAQFQNDLAAMCAQEDASAGSRSVSVAPGNAAVANTCMDDLLDNLHAAGKSSKRAHVILDDEDDEIVAAGNASEQQHSVAYVDGTPVETTCADAIAVPEKKTFKCS